PNAVAVSADGRTLFVANAAENAVAVVDADAKGAMRGEDGDRDEQGDEAEAAAVRGLIPTGWYPTAVALDPGGRQLFIASGYGFGSIAPTDRNAGRSYQDRKGVVSILDVPGRSELEQFTRQVRRNNRRLPALGCDDRCDGNARGGNPIPMHLG